MEVDKAVNPAEEPRVDDDPHVQSTGDMMEEDLSSDSNDSNAVDVEEADPEPDMRLRVKWGSQEYSLQLHSSETVRCLRERLFLHTQVLPARQKLLGLPGKMGKCPDDETILGNLKLRDNQRIMMVGTKEEHIIEVQSFVNKVKVLDAVENEEIHKQAVNLAKVENRVKNYNLVLRHSPRKGKKLLVLDIDYTIFDHKSVTEGPATDLMRPYLHEFLTAVYPSYDIALWSATSMRWIQLKMVELGLDNHPGFKIHFCLCAHAMITVLAPAYGGTTDVKPLGVIWGKLGEYYGPKNTIMFDDLKRNFLMNPKNGLRVHQFRRAPITRSSDTELVKLADYLLTIHDEEDLTELNHRKWESFLRRKRRNELNELRRLTRGHGQQ
eukprot:Clim_evm13s128 gene=Clim_evmTU13s128